MFGMACGWGEPACVDVNAMSVACMDVSEGSPLNGREQSNFFNSVCFSSLRRFLCGVQLHSPRTLSSSSFAHTHSFRPTNSHSPPSTDKLNLLLFWNSIHPLLPNGEGKEEEGEGIIRSRSIGEMEKRRTNCHGLLTTLHFSERTI